jgi:hypothetical protein
VASLDGSRDLDYIKIIGGVQLHDFDGVGIPVLDVHIGVFAVISDALGGIPIPHLGSAMECLLSFRQHFLDIGIDSVTSNCAAKMRDAIEK